MFRNKSDVDKRVSALLYNAKNEHERNLRCYNIALLYYKAQDFESAQRYAIMYLSVRDDSAAAHKLLGQTYEKLGQKDKAISSYTKSLKLETEQSDLILKICELLCDKDVEFDPQLARYWADRASLIFPHSPPVFMLKEKLMMSDSSVSSKDLEELLHAELKTKPTDMNVRIKLLKLYAESGRVELAVNHAFEVEARQTHNNSLIWYQFINNMCKMYNRDNLAKCDWEFYLQWISVLDRMCSLCISETYVVYDVAEVTESINSLDQTIYQGNRTNGPEIFKQFLKYISAQLAFYMGVLLLKKAKQDNTLWKETKKLVSPLFFLALLPPPSSDASWTLSVKENYRKFITSWVHQSHCRIVQAGYVLLSLSKENHSEKMFVDRINHFISSDWRSHIYEKAFRNIVQMNRSSSHFMTWTEFSKVLLKLPSSNSLRSSSYLSSFENANFGSLHHLVWLGLQQLKKISLLEIKLPSFRTTCFKSLQFTINNLNNVGVETINQLDIDTFLYATVFCAAAIFENQKTNGFMSEERLQVLPADISPQLCSSEQTKWWSNVCTLVKGGLSSNSNSSESISDLRFNLQRGLEVTRGEGLPPLLMVAIARTFASRAVITEIIEESDGCYARALHLWKLVSPILERFISNKSLVTSSKMNSLFDFPIKELNLQDAKTLLEEAKFFIGCHYLNVNQYEKAIEELKSLKSPQAVYNLAMVYQKWAEEQVDGLRGEEITSEIRCRNVVLASKAREQLVKVKALIKNDSKHPLYTSIETKLFEIDDMLARIEPENGLSERDGNGTLEGSESGGSDDFPVFAEANVISSSHRYRANHTTSTPRRIQEQKTNNFNMSELIDLLSVQHSTNQLKMQQVLDQVRLVVDKIEVVTSEQRNLIDGLTMRLNSFESEMKSNIAEMRKEIKRPDLSNMFDEDDYTDEMLQYQNYSQYYQHPQRAVQNSAAAIPYGNQFFSPRIDPLYQGNLSFYNQGALPFSDGQQLPDFLRAIPPGSQRVPQPLLHPSQGNIHGTLGHVPNVPLPNASKVPILPNSLPVSLHSNNAMIAADGLPSVPLPHHPPLSVNIPLPSHRVSSVPNVPHNFQIPLPPQPKPVLNIEERVEEETPPPAYDPLPDFKPLVPLPKEIEVCTGEEEEEVLFERKAKLFRFINSEWKERGIGNLKILKHKETGRFRILMRREQVHKICANHLISVEMNLEPKANADKAWVWVANDFADEEMRVEKFCARFKTPEDSLEFKEVFDNVKKQLSEQKGTSESDSGNALDLNKKSTSVPSSSSQNDVPVSSQETGSTMTNTYKIPSGLQTSSSFNPNLSTTVSSIALNLNVSTTSSSTLFNSNMSTTFSSTSFNPSVSSSSSSTPFNSNLPTSNTSVPFMSADFKQDTTNKTKYGGFSFCLSQPKLKIPEEPKEPPKVETTKENNPFSKLSNFIPSGIFGGPTAIPSGIFGGPTAIPSENDKSKSVIELKKSLGDAKMVNEKKENEHLFGTQNKTEKNKDNVDDKNIKSNELKNTEKESVQIKPLSSIIKTVPGSWECGTCYVRNNPDIQKCESCGVERSGKNNNNKAVPNASASAVPSDGGKLFSIENTSVKDMSSDQPSLSSLLKPPAGSWECKSCYLRNQSTHLTCQACNKEKPASASTVPSDGSKLFSIEKTSVKDMSSDQPSLSSLLKPPAGSWECKSCYLRNQSTHLTCQACNKEKPGSIADTQAKTHPTTGFVFGMPTQTDTEVPKFTFGSGGFPAKTFSFNATATKSDKESFELPSSQKPTEFSFATAQNINRGSQFSFGTPTFQFTMSEPKVTSPLGNKSHDESHDSEPEEEEGDHLQFQPVIPLPEKITVVTGEENEAVLYCQRAKLFRFDTCTKEWKERGIGDVKILKHNVSGKIRFLMRRDQVMKICLNHFITDDIILRPKDEKTWLWYAVDYSEGIQTKEQFAIRFKSSEVAKEFKEAFDKAQVKDLTSDSTLAGTSIEKTEGSSVKSSNEIVQEAVVSNPDSDLEITYEQKASPELVQKALALKLPANFYCYLDKPPCPGCCGCEADEDEIKDPKQEPSTVPYSNAPGQAMTQQFQQSSKESIQKVPGFAFNPKSIVPEKTETQFQELQQSAKESNQKVPEEIKPTFSIFGYNPSISGAAGFSFASGLQNSESDGKTSNDNSGAYFFKDKTSFNNPLSQNSIFGSEFLQKVQQSPGGPLNAKANAPIGSTEVPIFSSNNGASFESLAKDSSFGSFGEKKPNENFAWEGAGTKLFADTTLRTSSVAAAVSDEEQNDGDEVDENQSVDDHDPQYDPIVPLPDKIELKTGEEDEEILFIERGLLYRYDAPAKEWKQRGIGDIKILKHKNKNVYRLLMRREKVHKLVCNHLINADFELKPMSEKAFCWHALNYCPEESGDKPISESLSIRFKHPETAVKFKTTIDKCVHSLKEN